MNIFPIFSNSRQRAVTLSQLSISRTKNRNIVTSGASTLYNYNVSVSSAYHVGPNWTRTLHRKKWNSLSTTLKYRRICSKSKEIKLT